MFKSFFINKSQITWAYGLGLVIIFLICYQVNLTVQVNEWYGKFYDLLQNATNKNISEFWDKIKEFCWIVFPFIIVASITSYLTRIYAFKWRKALTFNYLEKWYSTNSNLVQIEGASQRIQEDIYRFAKIVENLGLSVIKAILTLIAFIPVLWHLSENVKISFLDTEGSLVWLSLIVSIGGLAISWFVGWYLPHLEYNNQKVEAKFRKDLVISEDFRHKDDKEFNLESSGTFFNHIKNNYYKLFLHYGYFDLWINSFNQFMIIVPYLLLAPSLFSGLITLGIVVQTSNAFNKVRESFSVFIDNWTTVTELRSIYKRLNEFEEKLNE